MLFSWVFAAGAAILLAGLGGLASRKLTNSDTAADGPSAAHSRAVLSALFLMEFAIAVIVPWTAANTARQTAAAEAQALTEVYWRSAGLPATTRQVVRADVQEYLRFVADQEWPRLAHGQLLPDGWTRLNALRGTLIAVPGSTPDIKTARDNTLVSVSEVYSARRLRATQLGSVLPAGALFFTVLTGLVMLLFPYLAGARPSGMARAPFLVLAAMLGMCVYLVFSIDHVFTGGLAVGPGAFRNALHETVGIP